MKCLIILKSLLIVFTISPSNVKSFGGQWSTGFMNRHPHHHMHHPHHIRLNILIGPDYEFKYSINSKPEKFVTEKICKDKDKNTLKQVFDDHLCMLSKSNEEEKKLMKNCFNLAIKDVKEFPESEDKLEKFICDRKNSLKQRSIIELCFLRGLIFTLNETTESLVKFEPCLTSMFFGYRSMMLEPLSLMADLREAFKQLEKDPNNICNNPGGNLILKLECDARSARTKLKPELCGDKKNDEKISNWIKLTSCLSCGDNNCNLKLPEDLNRLKECWKKYSEVDYPKSKDEFMKYTCNSFDNAYEKSHLTLKCFAGQTLKHTPNKTPEQRIELIHNFTGCFRQKNPLIYEINPVLKDRYVTEGLILLQKRSQSVNAWKSKHCGKDDTIDPNGLLTKIEKTVNCLQANASEDEKELLHTCWRGMSKQDMPKDHKEWRSWACNVHCPVTKVKIITNCYFNAKGYFHNLPVVVHDGRKRIPKQPISNPPPGTESKATPADNSATATQPPLKKASFPPPTPEQLQQLKEVQNLFQCLMKSDIDPDML